MRSDRRSLLKGGGAVAAATTFPSLLAGCMTGSSSGTGRADDELLYVALPGVRNYLEWGGEGILVYDIANGHKLLRRIRPVETAGSRPYRVKGLAGSAASGRLFQTTSEAMACLDLTTEKWLWERRYEGGCDRLAIAPDGATLYVPSFEGPHWHVVRATDGEVLAKIEPKSGAHNTIISLDGSEAYLAGLKSATLSVADAHRHTIVRGVGPFSSVVRPFTVNGSKTLCFVNVNNLLGFEVGDLRTGARLHRIEVAGFRKGPVERHGCPSHGIGLTPDERELWIVDGANKHVHVFDATVMPPRQMTSIQVRYQPGWIMFNNDGRYAYPSTGEVIEVASKKIVATLSDEAGKPVQSEKMVPVRRSAGRPVMIGNQFGVGRKV